jgi:L-Lysine epsilon oxidase N-terminal/L-lysine epsilon oxidase C-terminal domain
MTRTYRIHPAIGVARVGDSPDDYFIGPEAPGVPSSLNTPDSASSPSGTYKDKQQRIKRQGARFRIYEYTEDAAGIVTQVREITVADAQIEWEVHLANRKAASPKFNGIGRRNEGKPESDLIIDAGPQRIAGADQAMQRLHGTFMQTMDVQLGDLLTDTAGRLIVLGGHGQSQALPQSTLEDFADNDGWCDDIADGPVRATLRLTDSATPIAADPAWVIVAPPDFAPPIENVVTLYDAVYNVMASIDPELAVGDETTVSFTKDIYPILRRVSHLHWVSKVAARRHGEGMRLHFISRVNELSSNKPQDADARDEIFHALRTPQGGGGNMPKLPDQAVRKAPGAALTEAQYKRMELWAKGKFVADWPGAEPVPTPFDKLSEKDQPRALDRAALEACVGGPFFPGIEASRVMLDETTYDNKRPFRINANQPPGMVTARMAVPWQADFNDCSMERGADWWPGQRPNQVRRGQEPDAEWAPTDWKHIDMVEKWSQLGFVVAKTVANEVEYVEDERFVKPSPPVV